MFIIETIGLCQQIKKYLFKIIVYNILVNYFQNIIDLMVADNYIYAIYNQKSRAMSTYYFRDVYIGSVLPMIVFNYYKSYTI